MIHVGDTVQFRTEDRDAYGDVFRMTDKRAGTMISIHETGSRSTFVRYADTVTVTNCPHACEHSPGCEHWPQGNTL